MVCPKCDTAHSKNVWKCHSCGASLPGGLVFVTGISGSGVEDKLKEVITVACGSGHEHEAKLHDVGAIMRECAREENPEVNWGKILDVSPPVLRFLRMLAFRQISYEMTNAPGALHLIDLHLCFRWKAFLTKGFEPHILKGFAKQVRCFINIIEDLHKIQARLEKTAWGSRKILELLIWRDEELLLADMFADACGHVPSYAVARAEPASVIEHLIWHPEIRKVYLSFPITAIKDDEPAKNEIIRFRDKIREFLVVFDPYACRDYEETYQLPEMQPIRKQIGEMTVDRDFRFIDQADAVVAYFPRKVYSKGVDAEMRHAIESGKPIYLYCPENLGGGPFEPPPSHYRNEPKAFIELLREKLATPKELIT